MWLSSITPPIAIWPSESCRQISFCDKRLPLVILARKTSEDRKEIWQGVNNLAGHPPPAIESDSCLSEGKTQTRRTVRSNKARYLMLSLHADLVGISMRAVDDNLLPQVRVPEFPHAKCNAVGVVVRPLFPSAQNDVHALIALVVGCGKVHGQQPKSGFQSHGPTEAGKAIYVSKVRASVGTLGMIVPQRLFRRHFDFLGRQTQSFQLLGAKPLPCNTRRPAPQPGNPMLRGTLPLLSFLGIPSRACCSLSSESTNAGPLC